MKTIHRSIKTNLKGLKEDYWHRNLTGFFVFDGRDLSDWEIRKIVDWGIANGYKYDTDIPADKVMELIRESRKEAEE